MVQKTIELLRTKFLLKVTGGLNEEGATATFLGRKLKRVSDGIVLYGTKDYYQSDLEFFGLTKAKPVSVPGSSALRKLFDGDEPVSAEEHSAYRRAVGKLQWNVPIRPDIAFSVKELARALTDPRREHLHKLKHLLKYMTGSSD